MFEDVGWWEVSMTDSPPRERVYKDVQLDEKWYIDVYYSINTTKCLFNLTT